MLIEYISVPFHVKTIVHGFKYSPTLKMSNMLRRQQVNIVTQIKLTANVSKLKCESMQSQLGHLVFLTVIKLHNII
jgi:hypothetical protein